MLRIIELLGLLAPVAAVVLLVLYRTRSRSAFLLGLAGSLVAALATAVGLVSERASLVAAMSSGGGMSEMLEQLDRWAWARFGLLVLGAALLVAAALVDRAEQRAPLGWIAGGLLLAVLGVAARGLDVPVPGHDGLEMVLGFVIEAVEAALLGVGILLLAVAAVAHRPGRAGASDRRPEPTDLARRAGVAAWRLYRGHRGSGSR